jgi:hypothetical protein
VQAARDRILICEEDPAEMHRLLANLPPLDVLSADELAQQAVSLYRKAPPKLLLKRHRIRMLTCVCRPWLSPARCRVSASCSSFVQLPSLAGCLTGIFIDPLQVNSCRVLFEGQHLACARQACSARWWVSCYQSCNVLSLALL